MTVLVWIGAGWLVIAAVIGRVVGAVIGHADQVLTEAEHFALWKEELARV